MSQYNKEIDKLRSLSSAISCVKADVTRVNDKLAESDNVISTWGLGAIISSNRTIISTGIKFYAGVDTDDPLDGLKNVAVCLTDSSITDRIESGLGLFADSLDESISILANDSLCREILTSTYGEHSSLAQGDNAVLTIIAYASTAVGREVLGLDEFKLSPDDFSFVLTVMSGID